MMIVLKDSCLLRESAQRYRDLASQSINVEETTALLQLADDFEHEATTLEVGEPASG